MFSKLWGKITGKDQGEDYPIQQTSFLGRIGNHIIAFPYGFFADLPDDVPLRDIAKGVAISVTTTRPSDTERGEPVFYHPKTNSRIIMRNDGNIELIPQAGKKVLVSGDFEVTGATALGATVTSNGQDIGETHTHGGVTVGAGTSGGPNS